MYYFSPDGKKHRSTKEVERYLQKEGITSLTVANFSYNGNKLIEDSTTRLAAVRRLKEEMETKKQERRKKRKEKRRTKEKKKRKRKGKKKDGEGGPKAKRRRTTIAKDPLYYCKDISGGIERVSVQCVNHHTTEKPEKFTYVRDSFPDASTTHPPTPPTTTLHTHPHSLLCRSENESRC